MKTADIRSSFLKYFESKGHTVVESSSIVPQNDPTLLFTNSGMVQFKDVFLGKDPRPYTRATTSQKCVRAGGKHNDLENVGFTARHHTFFEMLGNFSFGDYFKKDAITFAWEFVTQVLKLPKDRLYVTVFQTDDEAADLWHKVAGVAKDRIYRFGEKDNFWSMGDTGPCGPCSEIFIDRGQKYSCGKSTCAMGCDCDRYMEFWNLVFMQYNRAADGTLTPLPKPSVDTGAGLERIASILQDVDTNYDTDIFADIIQKTSDLAKRTYKPGTDEAVSFRVIADHSRATAFLIGDGVTPSNEGRGYVLRRIIRRAIRHGKKLGFTGPFMHKTAGYVIDQMREAYPDLIDKRAFIERAVLAEEEQFFKTLEKGLGILDEEIQKLPKATHGQLADGTHRSLLPGEIAFKLYDTFGFPLDLTRVICAEQGYGIDEAGFDRAMERQRSESRKHWKGSGEQAVDDVYLKLASDLRARNQLPTFVGYESLSAEGTLLSLLARDAQGELKPVTQVATPDSDRLTVQAIFNKTPFYGESGGQVGDRGRVRSKNGDFEAQVVDVQKPAPDLIVAHLTLVKGIIKTGQSYLLETDQEVRALTARNHTATHMLQWALREVLGPHVKQAGSFVGSDLLRFDFSHFEAMTSNEIQRVESMMNQKIWSNDGVQKLEMEKDQAIQAGAIAFFGEKYGDKVRVIKVGNYSTELCGGTHVDRSSDIHLFKIASETGIAAGVRRMIAYTSAGAFKYLGAREQLLMQTREKLGAGSVEEIPSRLDRLEQHARELKKQLEQLQAKSAHAELDAFLSKAKQVHDSKLVTGLCESNELGMKRLREMVDALKSKCPDAIVALGMKEPDQGTGSGKVSLIISVTGKAQAKYKANDLLKAVLPLIDGKGGGKPDLAQAGGTKLDGITQALATFEKLVLN